jgi:hypothetical protein
MEYITFYAPGENLVNAVLMVGQDNIENERYAHSFSKKTEGEFSRGILSYKHAIDESAIATFGLNLTVVPNSTTQITVMVDEKFMAKKPWDWEWTNWLYETKPRDQCQFRKRRILAYTIQPPLVAFMSVIYFVFGMVMWCGIWRTLCKTVAAIGLILWGIKPSHINWRAFNPNKEMKEIASCPEHLCLGDWKLSRDRFKNDLDPIRPIAILVELIWEAISPKIAPYLPAPSPIKEAQPKQETGPSKISQKLESWKERRSEAAGQRQLKKEREYAAEQLRIEKEREAERAETLALLSCETVRWPTLGELPPEKRTIHLRFLDLKAQLCKPFPRNI